MRKGLARDERGVSLVELLISLVIFTTALMALAQLMTMGVAASYQSQARSDAASLVKFQLEVLKAVSFGDALLAAGGSVPPAAAVAGYSEQVDGTGQVVANLSLHTRQWQIVDLTPSLKQITVAVTSNSLVMGRPVTVQISTLRTTG